MTPTSLAALVAIIALAACDGSSPDGAPAPDTPPDTMPETPSETPPDTGEPPDADEPLNRMLTGSLIVNDDEIDLVSGQRRVLEVIRGDRRGLSPVVRSPDGRYYAQVHNLDCATLAIDCVKLYYPDAGSFEFVVDVEVQPDAPAISPDGSMVIVSGKDDIANPLFRSLVLRVVSATPSVAELFGADVIASRDYARSSAFAPDGSIYYTRGDAIYHMASALQPVEDDRLVWEFDTPSDGIPGQLSISPDGTQIAIERFGGSDTLRTEQGIWIVQSDGSGARAFVTGDPVNFTRWPIWSPDGRWIAATVHGQSTGLDVGNAGLLAQRTFAFDASVQNHELGDEILDDTPVRFRIRALCSENEASCRASRPPDFVGGRAVSWRP